LIPKLESLKAVTTKKLENAGQTRRRGIETYVKFYPVQYLTISADYPYLPRQRNARDACLPKKIASIKKIHGESVKNIFLILIKISYRFIIR
jgi:hypothetical protein